MGFRAAMYGSQKSHNPWLKCHENEEKIENDYVLRNDNRIKTTQPISMILVSFFSEDNVLSDEIKNAIFLNIKVTKIERSAFLGHPAFVKQAYMESKKKRKKKRLPKNQVVLPKYYLFFQFQSFCLCFLCKILSGNEWNIYNKQYGKITAGW